MPTKKSQALKDQVLSKLEQTLGKPALWYSKPLVLKYGDKRIFVRVTTEKARDKFWFDVTPRLYKNHETDFLIYAFGKDSFYAEAHHIKPLGHPYNGPDTLSNMLCVCPNCHVKLDYRMILLNLSQLQTVDAHSISEEFVNYHNDMVSNH